MRVSQRDAMFQQIPLYLFKDLMWKYIVVLTFCVLVAPSAKEGMVDDCPAKINWEGGDSRQLDILPQGQEVEINIPGKMPFSMRWNGTTSLESIGVALSNRSAETTNSTKGFTLRISVSACRHKCAPGYVPYPRYDFTSRFVMWIAPVLMLLGNIHIPPLGRWNTYCVIVHALGDPMDFMASLITRLEVGSRLFKLWKEREVYREGAFEVSYFGDYWRSQLIHKGNGARGKGGPVEGDDDRIGPLDGVSQGSGRSSSSSLSPPDALQSTTPDDDTISINQAIPVYPTGLVFRRDSVWASTLASDAIINKSNHPTVVPVPSVPRKDDDHCVLAVTAVDLATICTAYDDLGHVFPYRAMSNRLRVFLRFATLPQRLLLEKALLEAAIDLSEAWADETFRVAVAVIGYLLVVAVSFIKTVDPWESFTPGGTESPPPPGVIDSKLDVVNVPSNFIYKEDSPNFNNRTSHSIAFAVNYSWVISAVILSAAAGGFTNRHAVEKILGKLRKKVPEFNIPEWESGEGKTLANAGVTGMNYTYRPVKFLDVEGRDPILTHMHLEKSGPSTNVNCVPHTAHIDRAPWARTLLVLVPLIASTTCAFLISWYTPTEGFGCRSLHQLCSFFLILASHGVTLLIQHILVHPEIRGYQYTCIIVKDTMVAAVHITFLFLAFYGLYNRCVCWSAWLSLGSAARVTLYIVPYFVWKMEALWPGLAFGGIGCQLIFCTLVIWLKPRCRIFRRSEKEQLQSEGRLRRYERQLSGDCNICNR